MVAGVIKTSGYQGLNMLLYYCLEPRFFQDEKD